MKRKVNTNCFKKLVYQRPGSQARIRIPVHSKSQHWFSGLTYYFTHFYHLNKFKFGGKIWCFQSVSTVQYELVIAFNITSIHCPSIKGESKESFAHNFFVDKRIKKFGQLILCIYLIFQRNKLGCARGTSTTESDSTVFSPRSQFANGP